MPTGWAENYRKDLEKLEDDWFMKVMTDMDKEFDNVMPTTDMDKEFDNVMPTNVSLFPTLMN